MFTLTKLFAALIELIRVSIKSDRKRSFVFKYSTNSSPFNFDDVIVTFISVLLHSIGPFKKKRFLKYFIPKNLEF